MASNAFWREGSGSPIFFSPIRCHLLVDVTFVTSSRHTSSSWTLSYGLSFTFLQWGTRKVHSGHAPIVRSPKMNLPWKYTFLQKYKIHVPKNKSMNCNYIVNFIITYIVWQNAVFTSPQSIFDFFGFESNF